ncbi:DUF4383 domain-containing protein [Quadrisphaera sp. DSM 44207]|uniref:DUF4383 domain-containing protein n=1 Tax=Quadrisphaera sp. DSM 44207 TaxID=1881057 RepID=UPI00088359D1|nr:DUF4383 domain-containing protein [Quadrisphaera sp. DSM 44207]SDQ64299.1 protein of unknown function [Quadrisphaera sp. DSM 44207]
MSTPTTRAGRGVNQTVALVFGAIYLLIGLLGFFVTADVGFASSDGDSLLGFEVNPLHNIAHLLIGLVLVLGSRTLAGARSANLAVGVVYLLLGILGLFIASDTNPVNILGLNGADNVLHLGTAIILLAVALGADKTARRGVNA